MIYRPKIYIFQEGDYVFGYRFLPMGYSCCHPLSLFGRPHVGLKKGFDTSVIGFKTRRECISVAKMFLKHMQLSHGSTEDIDEDYLLTSNHIEESAYKCVPKYYAEVLPIYWDFYPENYKLKDVEKQD